MTRKLADVLASEAIAAAAIGVGKRVLTPVRFGTDTTHELQRLNGKGLLITLCGGGDGEEKREKHEQAFCKRHGMIRVIQAFSVAAVVATLQLGAAAQQRPSTPVDENNPPTVQEQDALLGAWELDLAKSTFTPGPAPRGEIRSYQEEHEGIKAIILTTNADGSKTRMEYVASFNAPTAMVSGSQQTDAIRLKFVDSYTAEGELSFQGKPVGRTRREVAKDGQTMTITLDRTAPATVHNVFVYKRIP